MVPRTVRADAVCSVEQGLDLRFHLFRILELHAADGVDRNIRADSRSRGDPSLDHDRNDVGIGNSADPDPAEFIQDVRVFHLDQRPIPRLIVCGKKIRGGALGRNTHIQSSADDLRPILREEGILDRLKRMAGRTHVLERHVFKRDERILADEIHAGGKPARSRSPDRTANVERIDPAVGSRRHVCVSAKPDLHIFQDAFMGRADGIHAHRRPKRDFADRSIDGKRNDFCGIRVDVNADSPVHRVAALAVFARRGAFRDRDCGKIVSDVDLLFLPLFQFFIHLIRHEVFKRERLRRRVLFLGRPDRVGRLNAEIARQIDDGRKRIRRICRHSRLGSSGKDPDGGRSGKEHDAAGRARDCRTECRVDDQSGILRAQRQRIGRKRNVLQKSRRILFNDRNGRRSAESDGPADRDTARKVNDVRAVLCGNQYCGEFLKLRLLFFRQRNVRIPGQDLRPGDLRTRGVSDHGVPGTPGNRDLRA